MQNTNLTDKIYVLISFNGTRTYINKEEKQWIAQEMKKDIKFIEFQDEIYPISGLSIVKAEKLKAADMIKRGFWQCEQGHWNERGFKKCGTCYF